MEMDLGQADKSVRYLVNRSNENLIDYLKLDFIRLNFYESITTL